MCHYMICIIMVYISLFTTDRYIAPAIFVDVDGDDALMQEELFGPVLPVLTVNGIDEAIQFVNERYVGYCLVHVQLSLHCTNYVLFISSFNESMKVPIAN